VPNLEKDKFNSLEATNTNMLKVEALASLDDKAGKKFIAHDKVKARKVKDALEKNCLKEVEKKKNEKQDEKAKKKTEKGMGKKTNVQNEVTSTVLDEVL
jgi:ATP-dependent exoDNAse (exonuclease V) alpha subunit